MARRQAPTMPTEKPDKSRTYTVTEALDLGVQTVAHEMQRLHDQADYLTALEADQLNLYVRTLCALSKEHREQLAAATPRDLIALLTAACRADPELTAQIRSVVLSVS